MIRPCKFCGLECLASDRARADCFVCREARQALQQYSRMARENVHLAARVRELETQIAALQPEAANGQAT